MTDQVSPSELKPTERKHLAAICQWDYFRIKGGWRQPGTGDRITLKAADKLIGRGLVREHTQHGRKQLLPTGVGRNTYSIMKYRQGL